MADFDFYWYVSPSIAFIFGDGEEDIEEEIEKYKAELHRRFQFSPEGQAYLKRDDVDHLMWAEIFTTFSIDYLQRALWMLNTQDIRTILYEIFPEKIVTSPDAAPYIIDELRAYWEFIKREFEVENADKLLRVFNEKNIVKRLTKELGDSSKYGMAKSIMLPAIEGGLDVTDQEAVQSYISAYNTNIEAEMNAPIPEKILKKRDEIIQIFTPICKEHLNQDYLDFAIEIVEIMAETRPDSPLKSGQAKSWAAAIVYAIGQVNFLSDSSFEPYMRLDELCKLFGVSQQTASTKAREIRENLDMHQMHPDWTISSLQDSNPLIWIFMVDGFPMDIRYAPREVQEMAYEQGLIPYIPADQEED